MQLGIILGISNMKNLNKRLEVWFYVVPFVMSWMLIIQISGIAPLVSYEAIKKIPDAVMFTGLFYYLFSKYWWRSKLFKKWLIPYPNLQGTWEGEIKSTWVNPKTKKAIDPIKVQFCIKQSFEDINISMFTKESNSYSQAASFIYENDSTVGLSFTYSNKPNAVVRDRSEIHDGAACLRVVNLLNLALEGEYWTSRKTTGDIKITKISDKLTSHFVNNLKRALATA